MKQPTRLSLLWPKWETTALFFWFNVVIQLEKKPYNKLSFVLAMALRQNTGSRCKTGVVSWREINYAVEDGTAFSRGTERKWFYLKQQFLAPNYLSTSLRLLVLLLLTNKLTILACLLPTSFKEMTMLKLILCNVDKLAYALQWRTQN